MHADVALAIFAMAVASYACRVGGFVLMRYVAITPRTRAWLNAIPVALIGAILGPVAVKGGPAEWCGLAVAALAMRVTGNEFASGVAAIAVVATLRAIQA
jgi:uncharacterized membrane protein